MARYWSPEFTAIYVDALHRDGAFQRATRNFRKRIQLRCYDDPDGMDQLGEYEIDCGQVSYKWRTEPAPSRLRHVVFDPSRIFARTSAPYSIWMKLDRKEMGVIDAIVSPHYVFEGPKLQVLRHIAIFRRMNDLAASLPKEY